MAEDIADEDELARCLFEPKDSLEVIDKVLQLIKITSKNFEFNTDNDNQESVNCLRLFGNKKTDKCHETGLVKQKVDNERIVNFAKQNNKDPILRSYAGFATATHLSIKESSDEYITFQVLHVAELENHSHCNITLNCCDTLDERPRKEKSKFKNAAISKLSDKFKKYEKFNHG